MSIPPNVVSLFATEAELELSWQAYDTAQKHVHALYADGTATDEQRRHAAFAALEAETHFRAMFNRVPAARRIAGA